MSKRKKINFFKVGLFVFTLVLIVTVTFLALNSRGQKIVPLVIQNLDFELEIIKESVLLESFQDNKEIVLNVMRGDGGGELKQLRFIVAGKNKESLVQDHGTNLKQFGSEEFKIEIDFEPVSILVIPIAFKNDGTKVMGDVANIYYFQNHEVGFQDTAIVIDLDKGVLSNLFKKASDIFGGSRSSSNSASSSSGVSSTGDSNFQNENPNISSGDSEIVVGENETQVKSSSEENETQINEEDGQTTINVCGDGICGVGEKLKCSQDCDLNNNINETPINPVEIPDQNNSQNNSNFSQSGDSEIVVGENENIPPENNELPNESPIEESSNERSEQNSETQQNNNLFLKPFTGRYYNNGKLKNSPVLIRKDSEINFDWETGSPDPAVVSDKFSVDWFKEENLPAGTYNFTVRGDEGIRFYIDGHLIIDHYVSHRDIIGSKIVNLTEGVHEFNIKYYENRGKANVYFKAELMQKIDDQHFLNTYTMQIYNNLKFNGNPTVTIQVPSINFDWGNGPPHNLINKDSFSIRWTKTEFLKSGTYKFTARADNGIRVFVDGEEVLNAWRGFTGKEIIQDIKINEGENKIVIEYYESKGKADIFFDMKLLTEIGESGCKKDSDCNDGNQCTSNICERGHCKFEINDKNHCEIKGECVVSTRCSQGECIVATNPKKCPNPKHCSQVSCNADYNCVYNC